MDGALEKLQEAESSETMKVLEQAIVQALLPYRDRVDPLIGVIALTRCLRVMLRAGSLPAQRELLPVIEDYLRGRATPRHERLFWLPGDGPPN